MSQIFRKIKNYAIINYKRKILKDPTILTADLWFKDKGDSTLRLNYPLTPDSVVFDVGGYQGNWSDEICKRFNPNVYIFEPIPSFYFDIQESFKCNPKVKIKNFGFSDKNEVVSMLLLQDGSSVNRPGGKRVKVVLRDIAEFLLHEKIVEIDLIKINIEGGEYILLKHMLEHKVTYKCKNIQVQFHNFIQNAFSLREEIRNELKKTHVVTYDYPFVWENWRRK